MILEFGLVAGAIAGLARAGARRIRRRGALRIVGRLGAPRPAQPKWSRELDEQAIRSAQRALLLDDVDATVRELAPAFENDTLTLHLATEYAQIGECGGRCNSIDEHVRHIERAAAMRVDPYTGLTANAVADARRPAPTSLPGPGRPRSG